MSSRVFFRILGLWSIAALASACDGTVDLSALQAQRLTADLRPASPTNAYADDAKAALLGQKLFFDKQLSSDGSVACASCHSPDHGFSDPRPFSVGVGGQLGGRHAMPVTATALQPFVLWDGRADALWQQPLKAMENDKEMNLTRLELARRISTRYPAEYQAIFGDLPNLDAAPQQAKPGTLAWAALPVALQTEVDRVAANVGKAIEAYERRLLCDNTRFDQWAAGTLTLTAAETRGAETFVRAGCANCHSGPAFSDGKFHNVGVPSSDRGRAVGRELLLADPFNGAGAYSDDPAAGQAKLSAVPAETGVEGAFKTPSLRGVAQRTFFGHAAHQQTLGGFVRDIYRGGRGRGERSATVGTLDPLLQRVEVRDGEVADLVAFLHTLDCAVDPALAKAP